MPFAGVTHVQAARQKACTSASAQTVWQTPHFLASRFATSSLCSTAKPVQRPVWTAHALPLAECGGSHAMAASAGAPAEHRGMSPLTKPSAEAFAG